MKSAIYFVIFLPLLCFSQEFDFVFEPEAFPVEINGWQTFSPWAGGYSETAPDFCDIDGDGDLDLFIGEYCDPVKFFRNTGNESSPDYHLETAFSDSMSSFTGFGHTSPDFFDLDNDNDLDVLVGSGYVTYIENTGTLTVPNFLTSRDTLFDIDGDWVFGTHVSLADIDSDGDGDLICGEYQGHLQFYRNVGTPDSSAFYLEDDNWLGVSVGSNNGSADPCLIDIDNDNDYDLFIGERYGKIWYYRNDGDSVNYDFTFVTDYFDSIDVGYFSSPEFADVDGDGDYDMFTGREHVFPSNLLGDVFFYENTGTPESPQFEFITTNYLTADIGYSSHPQFVDINNDQAVDMIVGDAIKLMYFQNTGSSNYASFTLAEAGFQNIEVYGIFPCFIDIDGDGDYDLVCGESTLPDPPSLSLYLNEGTPEEPDLILSDPDFITNPDFFVNINPGFADIDGDGDYDLFISDDLGRFYYYQNVGTAEDPRFTLITSHWQGIQFSYPQTGWRGFSFGDLDFDGDLDLLMRNIWQIDYDNLRFYRNTGTVNSPVMRLETNVFLPDYVTWMAKPYLSDIDNDNDLDLFVGGYDGGIMFFRNMSNYFPPLVSISIQDNDIILTWGSIANAVEYRIFYRDIPYFTPEGIPQAIVLPPDTVWVDEGGVSADPKRFYRMVVAN